MRKVLAVMGMQNDFITGQFSNAKCSDIVPKVIERIKSEEYSDIIVTQHTKSDSPLEPSVPFCVKDTEGWELHPQVEESLRDAHKSIITRITDRATFLSQHISGLPEKVGSPDGKDIQIDCIGIFTDMNFISNIMAVKTTSPEVKINVISDACVCITIKGDDVQNVNCF